MGTMSHDLRVWCCLFLTQWGIHRYWAEARNRALLNDRDANNNPERRVTPFQIVGCFPMQRGDCVALGLAPAQPVIRRKGN